MSRANATAAPTAPRLASRRGARRIIRRPPRAYTLPLAGLILLLHLLLALLVFDPTPFTGGDNAGYIALAQSLLEGRGYLELYDPATPPHTQYPPAFPGVIAAALALRIRPWVGLKLVIVGFSLAAVCFAFLWLRRRGWPGAAPWVALLVAVSPGVLELSHWILSDVPFAAFTLAALWGFERLRPDSWGRFTFAAVAATLAYFTRSAGLPLIVAVVAWLALRRHWRQLAAFLLLVGPLAVAWWLRARMLGGVDYVQQFMMVNPYAPDLGRIGPVEFVQRIIENDKRYLSQHLPVLLFGLEGRAVLVLSVAIVLLAAIGWGGRLRRPGVAELFLPLYVGLLLAWPAVWSGERFLLPVLPLILAYAGIGLTRLSRRFAPRLTRYAGPVAAVLVLAAAAPALRSQVEAGGACTLGYAEGDRYPCLVEDWRDYFEIAEWSRRALPDGAVVLSRKPRLFYLISGHRGRVYPLSADPDVFFATAREVGARYVVLDYVDSISGFYLAPVLLRRPESFCIMRVLASSRAVLFGIDEAGGAGEAAAPDPLGGGGGTVRAEIVFPSCPAEYWRGGGQADPAPDRAAAPDRPSAPPARRDAAAPPDPAGSA
ncbi:MAG TPA: hypothetical protein VF192_06975 [Longimicrobiales bacterium]